MLLKMIAICLLLGSTAAAAQPAAAPRAPTGKWAVDFSDAQCLASRPYGKPGDSLDLVLKAPPLGDAVQVAIMRTGPPVAVTQVAASVTFDSLAPYKTSVLVFGMKESALQTFTLNLPPAEVSRLRTAKTVAFRTADLSETLAITQLPSLMKMLDKCVTDLRQGWNIGSSDGEKSMLSQRARANLARYIKNTDYPRVAMDRNATGIVKFAVLINETGRIADCTVMETSGVAALDAQTCAIMKSRAKFEPAIGPNGKAAKDAAIARVRWVIPD
jgi:TonB family protein